MTAPFYILAAGQSNMVGTSAATDTAVNPNVKIWNPATQAWEIARIDPQIDPGTGLHGGASMAWFAAKAYQEARGGEVRMIIDAADGRPLNDWLVTGDRANDGIRYDSLVGQYHDAGSPRIGMFLFAQGESNDDDASPARTDINTGVEYEQALHEFFGQLISDGVLGYGIPVIMPELADIAGVSTYDDRNDVVAQLDTDFDPFTRTAHADTGNVAQIHGGTAGNAIHWNLAGLDHMGDSVLEAYRAFYRDGQPLTMPTAAAEHHDTGAVVNYALSGGRVIVNLETGRGALGLAQGDTFAPDVAVIGSRFMDYLRGGAGDDLLKGNRGGDTMFGLWGDDVLFGEYGDDQINGGTGNDRIFGGNGADALTGSWGDDHLSGGLGADWFYFLADQGHDTIHDFESGIDRIWLKGHTLYGGMSFETFRSHLHDRDGDTVISTTGALWDANSIVVVGLSPEELSAQDFIL